MKQVDEIGFEYHESLPSGYREAEIEDFTINGRRKLGMQFLVLGIHWKVYQVYTVTESLTSKKLMPFIEADRCFVQDNN